MRLFYNFIVSVAVGYTPTLYTTSEGLGLVVLTIEIFNPPSGGTPLPFSLTINTEDGTAGNFSIADRLHILTRFFVLFLSVAGAPDRDYNAVNGDTILFNIGDTVQMHTIVISDDLLCENMPDEFFFSNIALTDANLPVTVVEPRATVFINDSGEAECGKYRQTNLYAIGVQNF